MSAVTAAALAPEHLGRFLLAGRARFTLVSKATGTRFTYQVRRKADADVFFVSVLTGSDNENAYTYVGFVKAGRPSEFIHGGQKARITRDAPSAKALAWAWPRLSMGDLPTTCEVHHEGRCGRCGRALTVPESITMGLGPECAGK